MGFRSDSYLAVRMINSALAPLHIGELLICVKTRKLKRDPQMISFVRCLRGYGRQLQNQLSSSCISRKQAGVTRICHASGGLRAVSSASCPSMLPECTQKTRVTTWTNMPFRPTCHQSVGAWLHGSANHWFPTTKTPTANSRSLECLPHPRYPKVSSPT
jgi:hypothetical protein